MNVLQIIREFELCDWHKREFDIHFCRFRKLLLFKREMQHVLSEYPDLQSLTVSHHVMLSKWWGMRHCENPVTFGPCYDISYFFHFVIGLKSSSLKHEISNVLIKTSPNLVHKLERYSAKTAIFKCLEVDDMYSVEQLLRAGCNPLQRCKRGYNAMEYLISQQLLYCKCAKVHQCGLNEATKWLLQHVDIYQPIRAFRGEYFLTSFKEYSNILELTLNEPMCGSMRASLQQIIGFQEHQLFQLVWNEFGESSNVKSSKMWEKCLSAVVGEYLYTKTLVAPIPPTGHP